jgi:glycosyltransferase involved in cell wall biosynthesis
VFFNKALLYIPEIVFFTAIVAQVIYFTVYLIAFSRKRNIAPSTSSLPVSVIICAHDEDYNLKELIPLLLTQDYPEFEVIIVDDRSNDSTFDYLLEETKKDHRLRMVHVNRTPPHVNGKKYALTLGIKAAHYDWILLTDADCRPHDQNWIKSMGAHMKEETQFVIGSSPYLQQPGFLNLFIRFESLVTAVQYISFALLGKPYMGVGRNLAYRKSMFLEVKGFHQFLPVTGGDDDLFVNQHARKENTSIAMGVESLTYSVPKRTWADFFYQKVRHLSVGKYYRGGNRFLLGLFSMSWLVSWFVGVPTLFISEIPYLILGALAFRIILLTITVHVAAKHLGYKFESWLAVVLDFIYAFYYLVTGLVALLSKKVRWKRN